MKIPQDWNVLPLKADTKYPPMLKDWQNVKYPREKIREHKGNYALGTGMISNGVIVFDWDFRRGSERKEEGIKLIYSEFKEKLPKLAQTLIVETPHGYHFYYILKDDKISNTSQKNARYDKKKFIGQNITRFGTYLAGLDTRANGGYVVCPPSKIDGFKYAWKREQEPIEITLEEYNSIFKFFELPEEQIAENTVRKGFVDVLEGRLNPNEMNSGNEHVLWKELFHECAHVGLLPKDLLEGLQQFQKGFDLEKTKEQLNNKKNIEYILNGKRLSTKKYQQYFNIKPEPADELFFEAPKDAIVIPYDNSELHVFENYVNFVFRYKNKIVVEKILDCSFKIFKKCYHKKEERFSYILNDKTFHTDTIMDILRRAEPYLRKGLRGKDCLKEVISYYSNHLKYTKPREFLGFDNEWILPSTEDQKNVSIVVITDYQQEAYMRAQKILETYTEESKQAIKILLTQFVKITQCEPINLAILIGWSISAPFRLYFIKKYDLFPILYDYGPPNTGRSTLEDFWIIDFYKIYDSHLPPNTSLPRLEDHLSKSTFPYSLQDIKETNLNRDIVSMLQDYSTSIGLFERKKGSKEIEFIKYKIAGLNLDSNDILEMFSAPAINERQVFIQYNQKIQLDFEWTELRNQLQKYKLFSLIYDYTKNWKNKDIEKLYTPTLEKFNTTFKTNSSRLLKSGAIIQFGLDLFSKVFGIEFKFTITEIMDTIIAGSTKMTEYLVDQFREFCNLAINYDETTQTVKETVSGESYISVDHGENPHYLNHKLKLCSDGDYYAYTSSNHEDYRKRYGERSGMKAFIEKIHKGMSLDEVKHIEYNLARPFQENGIKCKPMGIIKVYPDFLADHEIDSIDGKQLTLTEVKDKYGEPPNE